MQKIGIRGSKKLRILCAAAYFTSYLTRMNFAAVLAAIIQADDIDKTLAGAVTTLGFITYGAGQLVSGWLGDRINPKKLMFGGFLLTAAMNMLISVCPNGKWMCLVWAVNGFAQAFMWPPMVKIMKNAMDDDGYNKGVLVVNLGATFATVMIYLISPFIIRQWSWRAVFRINGTAAVVMAVVWMIVITEIEKTANLTYVLIKGKSQKKEKGSLSVNIGLLAVVMLAIMLQGSLRDGVTTWVPTYITEVFRLDSSNSILTSVVIPIFSFISLKVSSVIYNKTGKKPYKLAGIFFAAAALCAVILRIFSDVTPILTVALAALLVGIMHGVNLILVCFLPAILAGENNMSVLSGMLNFTTYVGSAISTFGFAVFSEKTGWSGTVTLWAVIAALGAVMCILGKKINKNLDKKVKVC